jgi:hypothetical protein
VKNRRFKRSGYTFLEVTLALGISLVLIAGIYSSVQMCYQQWEVGRQSADEAQLVRSLFQRIRSDMHATMTSWTPPQAPQAAAAATTASTSTGTTTASSGTTPSALTSSTATPQNTTDFPPGGVFGGPEGFSLVIRASPADLDFSENLPPGTTASVLRTVSYRLGAVEDRDSVDDGANGLLRDESQQTPDTNYPDGHTADGRTDLLAPEVQKLKVSYYDGLYWNDTWDAIQTGPPVCVLVEVGLKLQTMRGLDSDGLRWYRATIYFPPAASAPESSAAASSGATSSSTTSGATSGSTGATTGATTGGGAGS